MGVLSRKYNVDGTIGPFGLSGDMQVRPTFRGRDDESNPKHWTITINQHTQGVLEDVISASKPLVETASMDEAVRILHDSINACRPRLTDEYNRHGYDLLRVELKVPSRGVAINSRHEPRRALGVSKHDMVFWHTHDPEMAPEAELHSHDVELSLMVSNDNAKGKLVEISQEMHERLHEVAEGFFAQSANFSNVTMELASERLFDAVLDSVPELDREAMGDYLHGIGIRVIYDGSLDHPDYPVEFTRTLA